MENVFFMYPSHTYFQSNIYSKYCCFDLVFQKSLLLAVSMTLAPVPR